MIKVNYFINYTVLEHWKILLLRGTVYHCQTALSASHKIEDSFPPAEAYYSLPYLIWNLSLSLDDWLLSMNFDTVAWKCSFLAALLIIRCCSPICLMGQVQMGKYQMQMKHTMILFFLWNNVEISHWSWLPESCFHHIYSFPLLFPLSS